MKIEITKPLELSSEQNNLLNNHSLLNILTILVSEIGVSGIIVKAEAFSNELRNQAIELKSLLNNSLDKSIDFSILDDFREEVNTFFNIIRSYTSLDEELRFVLRESHENVIRVLDIFESRLVELKQRNESSSEWVETSIEQLNSNFNEVLNAIAKNSKGKYNIVSNIAKKSQHDYMVNLKIESQDSSTILMPPVLQDCLRDLIANARKYTKPGGIIHAGLYNNGESITMVISDTGCGIPPEELHKVVDFGYRASNVAVRPTMGGGFGLTKAYHVTQQHYGRMWIESDLDKGTTITIKIPVPVNKITSKRNVDFSNLMLTAD